MIVLTPETLKLAAMCDQKEAEIYAPILNVECLAGGITTRLKMAAFIAQISHESSRFTHTSENLNYSENALLSLFGKYFTPELAYKYARKPEMIANRIYANRMGNGDEASGDGWKHRGFGLIQLTGKLNHQACGTALGIDLVNHPELLTQPLYAVKSAIWYWNSHDLSEYAEQDDLDTISDIINRGHATKRIGDSIGWEDRLKLYTVAKEVL